VHRKPHRRAMRPIGGRASHEVEFVVVREELSFEPSAGVPSPLLPVPPRRNLYREAAAFAILFALAYGAVATYFCARAPHLFVELDQAFDADLGLWTIDLARPQGPHSRTRIHPLSVLLLNPAGSTLRAILRAGHVDFAGRLAAALLCAAAGGLTVGVFRVLLDRLEVGASRARRWALVFGLSTTQVIFSSLPESYAFSALGLVLVFAVEGTRRPSRAALLATGVFAFGITVTNIVAVALARVLSAAPSGWERLRRCALHVSLVLVIAAALSVVQGALYPTSVLFFVPQRLPAAYVASFPALSPSVLLERLGALASHVPFVSLAAPRLLIDATLTSRIEVDFEPFALATPTLVGGIHWLLWATLLVRAAMGLGANFAAARDVPEGAGQRSAREASRPVVVALMAWLLFELALHLVFGVSLFLYSGHWTFAVVALAAVGLEKRPLRGTGLILLTLAALQLAANGNLVRQMVETFSH